MIKKIRLMLEYNTYCIWLYNENNEIIDNNNPPEWDDDKELTDAFMAVSDIYDTFFIDNKYEFRYIGCKDEKTLQKLNKAVAHAVKILMDKNNGKYEIVNDRLCQVFCVNSYPNSVLCYQQLSYALIRFIR